MTVLALLSPYVLVLGAVSVVVSAFALVVQAARRRPWRQAGVVALTCVALTVIFGVVSDGIYDTGTGVEVSVTSVSEPDAEESGAPQYEETAPRPMTRASERLISPTRPTPRLSCSCSRHPN